MIPVPDILLIPYGTSEWSPDGIAVEGFTARSLRLRTAFPCVAINRAAREPLRFNNGRYDRAFAPNTQADATDEAGFVRDYLKGLCRPWDNLAAGFVDTYFRVLSEVVDEHRNALAERLAPYAGLYDYRDWLFSAPKPLPRAHLHAPPLDAAPTGGPADFCARRFRLLARRPPRCRAKRRFGADAEEGARADGPAPSRRG